MKPTLELNPDAKRSLTATNGVIDEYNSVRCQSVKLCDNLSAEDMTAQSMPDASPIKWHLAHTTWFFETFILAQNTDYKPFDPSFDELFNSYYVSFGKPYTRRQRGLITRPGVAEILAYRQYVDEYVNQLDLDDHTEYLLTVGMHHEMQHQELMLTDILHLFSLNPTSPVALPSASASSKASALKTTHKIPLTWQSFEGGFTVVGAGSSHFSYDCERPAHSVYLNPFRLANRPINNAEWLEFMDDGGYKNPLLWLSDGWAMREQENWQTPEYWQCKQEQWFQFGLDGLKEIDLSAPVSHISFYEAMAFACWAGKRLPSEFELELAAGNQKPDGNFAESQIWRPRCDPGPKPIQQLYGDVWEWTLSPYLAYPGFKSELGALGEYNGKFMCNQFVLRGGSCVTPVKQMRSSYRNFFYPHQRWQFTGLRLASD